MGIVREYIFSLMIVSACCGVVSILTPDNTSLNKYVHLLLSLIVTVILLSPISSIIGVIPELIDNGNNIDISDIEPFNYDYTDSIITETVNHISEEIKLQIKNKFNISPEDVLIYCDSENVENIIIDRILIIYPSENELLFSDTIRFVGELIGGECEVECQCEVSE